MKPHVIGRCFALVAESILERTTRMARHFRPTKSISSRWQAHHRKPRPSNASTPPKSWRT